MADDIYENARMSHLPRVDGVQNFDPVTLTYDLWPWPTTLTFVSARVCLLFIGQAVQLWEHRQTDEHIDRQDQ